MARPIFQFAHFALWYSIQILGFKDHFFVYLSRKIMVLGDPEVTANIYFKSRNLPNTDTQNYGTVLR